MTDIRRLPRLRHPKLPVAMRLWARTHGEAEQWFPQTVQYELQKKNSENPVRKSFNRMPAKVRERNFKAVENSAARQLPGKKNQTQNFVNKNALTMLPEMRAGAMQSATHLKSGTAGFTAQQQAVSARKMMPVTDDDYRRLQRRHQKQFDELKSKNLSQRLRLELAR